jgi:predicted dehydrogenase
MDVQRIAVIDCGGIGYTSIIPAINAASGLELCGFSSRDPNKTRADASRKKVEISVPGFSTPEQLLEEVQPSGVIVVGVSGLHFERAKLCLSRGIDTLVEKPIATTQHDLRMLGALCAQPESGRLGGIFQKIYTREFELLLMAATQGRFGEGFSIEVGVPWYRSSEYYGIEDGEHRGWKGTLEFDGGGAGMNQGIHHWDMALRVAQAQFGCVPGENPIRKLRAKASRLLHHQIEAEDTILIEALMGRDSRLSFFSTTAATEDADPLTDNDFQFEAGLRQVKMGDAFIRVCGDSGEVVLRENAERSWSFSNSRPYDEEMKVSTATSADQSTSADPLALGFAAHQRAIENFFTRRNSHHWRLRSVALAPWTLCDAYTSASDDGRWRETQGLRHLPDGETE